MGGNPETNLMDFVTISSTGNAQDFGDMTQSRQSPRGAEIRQEDYPWVVKFLQTDQM